MRGYLGEASWYVGQAEAERELVVEGAGSAEAIELRGGEAEVANEGQQEQKNGLRADRTLEHGYINNQNTVIFHTLISFFLGLKGLQCLLK